MNKFREMRERLGLTQQELAEELGVDRCSISNYELGRREPNSKVFSTLQEKYKISDKEIGMIIVDISKSKRTCKNG